MKLSNRQRQSGDKTWDRGLKMRHRRVVVDRICWKDSSVGEEHRGRLINNIERIVCQTRVIMNNKEGRKWQKRVDQTVFSFGFWEE